MKIDKALPALSGIDTAQPQRPTPSAARPERPAPPPPAERRLSSRWLSGSAGFSLQLNDQLLAMQAADRYLADLEERLAALKLSLSRALSRADAKEKPVIERALRQVEALLAERAERTGGALDATFRLSLNEPSRTRLRLAGLDTLQAVREAGRETLLVSAGAQVEPVAVALEEGLSDQQLLRRFNDSLGRLGLRAELDGRGGLVFSARESDWQALAGRLTVQGEGRLFPREPTSLEGREERFLALPAEMPEASRDALRGFLDEVLAALEQVTALREQLAARQREIRRFLAEHAGEDEREWAARFSESVRELLSRQPSSYSAVTRMVLAQANLSRYEVVSLLA